ncbi:MAG TPA: MOSC domain-containing protein [Terriglobia bacterium]|nr:MOSC domain-containing protein [Terriglobia bacterium]
MKVLSVNVGLPRQVILGDRAVTTGIYKSPVQRRVKVSKLNIVGDAQADLSVHGGLNKALYAYHGEHYEFWRSELPGMEIPWGMFGENLTLEGLLEDNACIGDRFRIGTAVVLVTQPRLPCYKLGIRFGRDDMPERFLSSRRTGFYFAVVEEGELGEGDAVEPIHRGANLISIADLLRLNYDREKQDPLLIERALQVEALTPGWRKRLLKRLEESKD